MTQTFAEPTTLGSVQDVQAWRSAWMGALSSWHSPYKALIDCEKLNVSGSDEVTKALQVMIKFFNGFFLRKAVGFNRREGQGHEHLPFTVHVLAEDAAVDAGIRAPKERVPTDFRSLIHLQNHFQQHVVELSFAEPVVLQTKEQVQILRGKMMNNLMQWHSKWSLIVDCANLQVAPEAASEFQRMLTVLRGFFMKHVVGYSPRGSKESYPFEVFRARHRAAQALEAEGAFSGDKADCKSRTSKA